MLELETLRQKLRSQGNAGNNVAEFSAGQLNSSGPIPTTIHDRCYACGKRLFAQLQRAPQGRRTGRRVTYIPVFVSEIQVKPVSPLRISGTRTGETGPETSLLGIPTD